MISPARAWNLFTTAAASPHDMDSCFGFVEMDADGDILTPAAARRAAGNSRLKSSK
ncbi:MAG: hypothetical protein ACMUIU_13820 [bacterium]